VYVEIIGEEDGMERMFDYFGDIIIKLQLS